MVLPLNTIAQTLGYDVAEAESGRVAITVHPAGAHLNPRGTVHGGLTATLLDSCMGLAIQSMLDKGIGSTTLEFKISLVRAITLETGQIRAEGKVLNCGRRVGTAEGRVIDAKGRLLAHGTTTSPELTLRNFPILTPQLFDHFVVLSLASLHLAEEVFIDFTLTGNANVQRR